MSLFVGNISKNVRRQDLVDDFEKFGKCDINIKVQPLVHSNILLLSGLCLLSSLSPPFWSSYVPPI